MAPPRILIVEDDPAIAAFVQTALEREGFAAEVVQRGETALERAEAAPPDLILLDLMLPGLDGLQVCQAIRRRSAYIPVIMLTAKDDDVDKIVGLEIGADDYITKPFKTRELIARVRAILRLIHRSAESASRCLRFGALEINLDGRTVTREGQLIGLTPKEFDLLALLASTPGRVFGRDTLLEKVWGFDYADDFSNPGRVFGRDTLLEKVWGFDYADDFSTAGKGWGFVLKEGSAIQDGVARLRVKEGNNGTGNAALNRKDFVLQLDARVAEGDKATQLIVHFHNLSGEYWFYLVVNSAGNTWLVDKNVPGDQRNLANGSGNVSPFGETTRIMIVARGPHAAVYLNDTPVAYFDDADFDTSGGTGLFCQSLGQAVCEFDNVKVWNLANVPGLP
jgi:two-component system response regulator MtrA